MRKKIELTTGTMDAYNRATGEIEEFPVKAPRRFSDSFEFYLYLNKTLNLEEYVPISAKIEKVSLVTLKYSLEDLLRVSEIIEK